jgi:hypothetical protein
MKPSYLQSLDATDWAELETAYGAADKLPQSLTVLATGTPRQAADEIGGLWGTICHQGSVFDATEAAVPFLVAIALDPAAPARDGVIELLNDIADSPFAFVDESEWFADPASAAAEGERFGMTVEPQCRAAVLAAAPTLVDALPSGDPATQVWTLVLAAALREGHDRLVPSVESHAGAVTHPWAVVALELFRAVARPGPRLVELPPEIPNDMVRGQLDRVVAHLAERHEPGETARALRHFAEQISFELFREPWRRYL